MSEESMTSRILAAIDDVNEAESLAELDKIYEECVEMHGAVAFDSAYFVAKLRLEDAEAEEDVPEAEAAEEEKKEEEPMVENKAVDEKAEEIKVLLAKMEELQKMIATPRRATKKTPKYKNRGYKLLSTTIDVDTPQLLTVIDILKAIGADKKAMSEKDTIESMERNAKLFNITGKAQTAARIFKYYRPRLVDAGVIEVVRL